MIKKSYSKFQKRVWDFYRREGRDLPWRKTRNPYRILVSETMLQQTQVDRVLPKYREFLKRFPSFKSLANARMIDVFKMWQGLGYNRRALYLKRLADEVMKQHGGKLPRCVEELESLPGIGHYSARAIAVFVWSEPHVFIETNVRSVYLHTFFKNEGDVSDAALLEYIEKTLDQENPREWYFALMDYGVMLKKKYARINTRSKHYVRQSKFAGSNRQIRGKIFKELLAGPKSSKDMARNSGFSQTKIEENLAKMEQENLIEKSGKFFHIAQSNHPPLYK